MYTINNYSAKHTPNQMQFKINFSGHINIRSTHKKTIEITKETELTPRGDCIVGVGATCGCADIPKELKNHIHTPNAQIKCIIVVNDLEFVIRGTGNPELALTHQNDIVLRKSNFVCPRTLAVQCDKSSDDISQEMLTCLQNPYTKGVLTIESVI